MTKYLTLAAALTVMAAPALAQTWSSNAPDLSHLGAARAHQGAAAHSTMRVTVQQRVTIEIASPRRAPAARPAGIMVHPYPASANYCPSGLQPITMGGVICCGTPNTGETYYNRASQRSYWGGYNCPAGTKGCD